MIRHNLAICLFVASQLVACQSELATSPQEASSTKAMDKGDSQASTITEKEIDKKGMNKIHTWSKAKIKYFDLEGGFYGIITETGQKLLPANLSKEMRQDGAIVEVSGYFEQGMITFQQWGKPFKITSIKVVKEGSRVPKSEL